MAHAMALGELPPSGLEEQVIREGGRLDGLPSHDMFALERMALVWRRHRRKVPMQIRAVTASLGGLTRMLGQTLATPERSVCRNGIHSRLSDSWALGRTGHKGGGQQGEQGAWGACAKHDAISAHRGNRQWLVGGRVHSHADEGAGGSRGCMQSQRARECRGNACVRWASCSGHACRRPCSTARKGSASAHCCLSWLRAARGERCRIRPPHRGGFGSRPQNYSIVPCSVFEM